MSVGAIEPATLVLATVQQTAGGAMVKGGGSQPLSGDVHDLSEQERDRENQRRVDTHQLRCAKAGSPRPF